MTYPHPVGYAAGPPPFRGRKVDGDLRMEEPAVEAERVGERRALGAEAAEIRRMIGVAAHGRGSVRAPIDEHAAAHAAIGAGRADRGAGRSFPVLLARRGVHLKSQTQV